MERALNEVKTSANETATAIANATANSNGRMEEMMAAAAEAAAKGTIAAREVFYRHKGEMKELVVLTEAVVGRYTLDSYSGEDVVDGDGVSSSKSSSSSKKANSLLRSKTIVDDFVADLAWESHPQPISSGRSHHDRSQSRKKGMVAKKSQSQKKSQKVVEKPAAVITAPETTSVEPEPKEVRVASPKPSSSSSTGKVLDSGSDKSQRKNDNDVDHNGVDESPGTTGTGIDEVLPERKLRKKRKATALLINENMYADAITQQQQQGVIVVAKPKCKPRRRARERRRSFDGDEGGDGDDDGNERWLKKKGKSKVNNEDDGNNAKDDDNLKTPSHNLLQKRPRRSSSVSVTKNALVLAKRTNPARKPPSPPTKTKNPSRTPPTRALTGPPNNSQPAKQIRKCHQCKMNVSAYRKCHFWLATGIKCRKTYCRECLVSRYNVDPVNIDNAVLEGDDADGDWHCPGCLGTCTCTPCLKEQERRAKWNHNPSRRSSLMR